MLSSRPKCDLNCDVSSDRLIEIGYRAQKVNYSRCAW